MPLIALHHQVRGMHVVDEIHKERLLASGEWFLNPQQKGIDHEKQIRRNGRKGISNSKCTSEKTGSGT